MGGDSVDSENSGVSFSNWCLSGSSELGSGSDEMRQQIPDSVSDDSSKSLEMRTLETRLPQTPEPLAVTKSGKQRRFDDEDEDEEKGLKNRRVKMFHERK